MLSLFLTQQPVVVWRQVFISSSLTFSHYSLYMFPSEILVTCFIVWNFAVHWYDHIIVWKWFSCEIWDCVVFFEVCHTVRKSCYKRAQRWRYFYYGNFTFCCSGMCDKCHKNLSICFIGKFMTLFFFSFQIICLFSYINENYGAEMAYQFLRNVWVWYLVISVIFSSLSFHDLTDLCLKTLYARSTWLKS